MKPSSKIGAVIGAALSAIYLSNIGFGVVELIPDNIPVAGNLDEVLASIILLRCLIALGIDPMSLKQLAMRHVTAKKTIEVEAEEVKDGEDPKP